MTVFVRTRNQFGTWLALLAMCLVVFAPIVSQVSASVRAGDPEAAICSASLSGHAPHAPHTGSVLSACGYCDMLAAPAAPPPALVSIPGWLPLLTVFVRIPALRIDLPILAYITRYPRAPPSIS